MAFLTFGYFDFCVSNEGFCTPADPPLATRARPDLMPSLVGVITPSGSHHSEYQCDSPSSLRVHSPAQSRIHWCRVSRTGHTVGRTPYAHESAFVCRGAPECSWQSLVSRWPPPNLPVRGPSIRRTPLRQEARAVSGLARLTAPPCQPAVPCSDRSGPYRSARHFLPVRRGLWPSRPRPSTRYRLPPSGPGEIPIVRPSMLRTDATARPCTRRPVVGLS